MNRMVTLSFLLLTSAQAFAIPLPAIETPPGEVQSSFSSPNSISEFCSLPRILNLDATLSSGAPVFSEMSLDEKNSAQSVCQADFYDTRETTPEVTAVVVCPKVGSTNPALMLHTLPYGMKRVDYLTQECPKDRGRAGSLIAKFKQTISCSNTSSILSYPRIARALRTEIDLPITAYRSMDRLEHLEAAKNAKELVTKLWPTESGTEEALIVKTWKQIYARDMNPKYHRGTLYKADDSLIFGALVPAPAGGAFYAAANGSTAGDRVENFQKTHAFQAVTQDAPLSFGAKSFTAETAQKMVLLREMGDLIVLDTLLNQQDRFGNLEYRSYYLKVDKDGRSNWRFANKAQAPEMRAQGYVLVKRMLLADNDCGVSKENKMAKAGMALKIAHLHPDTYRGVQNLKKLAKNGLLATYLKSDFLFRDADVASVQANLTVIANDFKKRCLEGHLWLDADLAQAIGVKPEIDSVAFCKSI